MKRVSLFIPMCIGLLLPAVTARAASDGVNAMLLQGPSDFKLTILLDEQPVIKFSDDDLVVTTHLGDAVSIPSSLVSKYTYVKVEGTGITSAARFGSKLFFNGKHISMTNLTPSSAVQVYTVDGALVASATTDSRGNISLSLPDKSGAEYLVKTASVTFKISKP